MKVLLLEPEIHPLRHDWLEIHMIPFQIEERDVGKTLKSLDCKPISENRCDASQHFQSHSASLEGRCFPSRREVDCIQHVNR